MVALRRITAENASSQPAYTPEEIFRAQRRPVHFKTPAAAADLPVKDKVGSDPFVSGHLEGSVHL